MIHRFHLTDWIGRTLAKPDPPQFPAVRDCLVASVTGRFLGSPAAIITFGTSFVRRYPVIRSFFASPCFWAGNGKPKKRAEELSEVKVAYRRYAPIGDRTKHWLSTVLAFKADK
jgi:hypothetical protein